MNNYDNIIIGAGISGLYTAYNIKKMYPNETFIILEKNDKIGGRVGSFNFHGVPVSIGAGIGRFEKDVLLKQLLKELKIKYNTFPVDSQFSKVWKTQCDVVQVIKLLKSEYKKNKVPTTFKKFALSKIDKTLYDCFRKSNAYSDFENEDVFEVLYHYGLDDNLNGWIGMSIDWNLLLKKLSENIGLTNIKLKCPVSKINSDDIIEVFANNKKYTCNRLYVATEIETLKKLLITPECKKIYKQIHGQPFLRVYGKFSGESKKIMNEYLEKTTVVDTLLYRIIPIDKTKGVYMIAYTDNAGANYVYNLIKNDKNYTKLENLLKISLGIPNDFNLIIDDIVSYYWKCGTHYYEPLDKTYSSRIKFINKAQHPEHNIFVVGEVVSRMQGWVEGALSSVDKVL